MNLKEFFEDTGMTQATLSRRAGVSQATISKILRGHDIRLSIAIKISNATKKMVLCEELHTKIKGL